MLVEGKWSSDWHPVQSTINRADLSVRRPVSGILSAAMAPLNLRQKRIATISMWR